MRQGEVSSIFCLISNSIYYPRCSLYISPPRAETYHQVITLPILKLTPKYQKVFYFKKREFVYLSHLTTKNSEWCRLIDPWTTEGFYWFHCGIAGLWAEGRMQCRTNVQLECSWMMWSVMGRCNTHTQTHARAYKYTHIHVHTHTQYALIQWQWHTQTRIHTDTLTCIHIVHKLTHIGKQIQLQHVIATL